VQSHKTKKGGNSNLIDCNAIAHQRTNCNQTLVEWSLDSPLSKLCPVIPTFNQDGRQARNRKMGDEIKYWAHFLKGTTHGSFQQSLVEIGSVVSEKILFIFHPPFFYLSLMAILVESRDHRTQIWKGATQGPFHQSLVAIGSVFQTSDQDGRHSRT
jgi:hypothetical protein